MTEQLQNITNETAAEAQQGQEVGAVALNGFEPSAEATHIQVQENNSEVSHPDVRVEH